MFVKILLEGKGVLTKKQRNPKGGLEIWYGAAASSVKCYPLLIE